MKTTKTLKNGKTLEFNFTVVENKNGLYAESLTINGKDFDRATIKQIQGFWCIDINKNAKLATICGVAKSTPRYMFKMPAEIKAEIEEAKETRKAEELKALKMNDLKLNDDDTATIEYHEGHYELYIFGADSYFEQQANETLMNLTTAKESMFEAELKAIAKDTGDARKMEISYELTIKQLKAILENLEKPEESKEEKAIKEAKETGNQVLITKRMVEVEDYEGNSFDLITVWAMPDGKIKEEIQHTW